MTGGRWGCQSSAAAPSAVTKLGVLPPPAPPRFWLGVTPWGFIQKRSCWCLQGWKSTRNYLGAVSQSRTAQPCIRVQPCAPPPPPTVLCDPHSDNLNPSGPPIPTTPVLQDPHSHNPNPSGLPFLHPHSPRTPPPFRIPIAPPHRSSRVPQQHKPPPPPPLRASLHPQHCREGGSCSVPPQALICSSQGPLCADKQWVLLHADPHRVSQHWGGGGWGGEAQLRGSWAKE